MQAAVRAPLGPGAGRGLEVGGEFRLVLHGQADTRVPARQGQAHQVIPGSQSDVFECCFITIRAL